MRSVAGKFDKTDLMKTVRDTVIAAAAVLIPSLITGIQSSGWPQASVVILVAVLQGLQRWIKDNTK